MKNINLAVSVLPEKEVLYAKYLTVRGYSEELCRPLEIEDYVVQPMADVSPPKWHLGHTTWFFETFILIPHLPNYQVYDDEYNFVFNSYYETIGSRVIRTDRGNLSRPSVADIYNYRRYVDKHMIEFLDGEFLTQNLVDIFVLGLNHEQQHQELLLTDIKYILGHNPLFPPYSKEIKSAEYVNHDREYVRFKAGIYEIGFEGQGFCFDNEQGRHKVYLDDFEIENTLVTNKQYLDFIQAGGYSDFQFWHAEGWDWVKKHQAQAPLYWHLIDGKWMIYTLNGLMDIDLEAAVCHINFYEAAAYASWRGMRLPTEAEWEVSADHISWGERWEWTNSAYLPYPRFKKEAGAVGEYNGKFMINQMVLRGASIATPKGHSRKTYRNFFQTAHQWQFTGIRLAR